jgi:autophagy-related protein 101
VPRSREVLDITLPFVDDAELDTMIEKRAAELARDLDAERTHSHSSGSSAPLHHHLSQQRGAVATAAAGSNGGRGNISVQFFEKKRRKAWYMRAAYGSGDEEVCWECWTVKVTVAEPRTESGKLIHADGCLLPVLYFMSESTKRKGQKTYCPSRLPKPLPRRGFADTFDIS